MAKIRFSVKPNAGKNELGRDEEGKLWLRIAAPAQEGKANQAIIVFLSAVLDIPKSMIWLAAGSSGRIKTFETGLQEEELQERLRRHIGY